MVTDFSNQLADAVAKAAPSVVQVQGGRRPASGIVYGADTVLTTTRVLGRGNGFRVRRADNQALDAELAGWDPATGLAVLHVNGLDAIPAVLTAIPPRVGHLAIALARSWSNAITASAGLVSVIGGPLRTSRRGAIDEVIRTSAPMHDGFAGGAFTDVAGGLIGMTTASSIRGLNVVIPAPILWKTAAQVLEHGRPRRAYLGIAGQRVRVSPSQRADTDQETAVLVMQVSDDSPAAAAGVLVGDIVLTFDGRRVDSPDDLLDLLTGERIGRSVPLRISRGGNSVDLSVSVAERAQQS